MIRIAHVLLLAGLPGLVFQTSTPNVLNPLLRHCVEGQKLTYRMKGINESWHCEAQADGVVKIRTGPTSKKYGWSNFVSDGQKIALSPAMLNFRQQVGPLCISQPESSGSAPDWPVDRLYDVLRRSVAGRKNRGPDALWRSSLPQKRHAEFLGGWHARAVGARFH